MRYWAYIAQIKIFAAQIKELPGEKLYKLLTKLGISPVESGERKNKVLGALEKSV